MITLNDYYYGNNAHESWARGMESLAEIAATPIRIQSPIRPISAMTAAELEQRFASFASPTIRVPVTYGPRLTWGEPSIGIVDRMTRDILEDIDLPW